MTKSQAKKKLGVKTDYALAKALGIKPQAVAAWGKTVPQQRQWQIAAILSTKQPK